MEDKKWYSLTQASKKLGFGSTYVSVWLRRYRADFPDDEIIESGNSKMISDKGIKFIDEFTKKEGVLITSSCI